MAQVVYIGENLRRVRERNYLTQVQLAEKADISADTVVKIENNHVQPRPRTILKLAEVLAAHPDELSGFGREG